LFAESISNILFALEKKNVKTTIKSLDTATGRENLYQRHISDFDLIVKPGNLIEH
jgi:hypothetical protein